MVFYSSHVLNNELKVPYSDGRYLDGPDHLITDHLNNEILDCYSSHGLNKELKICYFDGHWSVICLGDKSPSFSVSSFYWVYLSSTTF